MDDDADRTSAADMQQPVLVTGATGRIGSAVIADLVSAGVPVRA